jgi:hypothetical protein
MARKPAPTRRTNKVVPLRSVAQLKIDLALVQEELEVARNSICQLETDITVLTLARTRASVRQASLLQAIRDAITEKEEMGEWSWDMHLYARFAARSFAKYLVGATKAVVWGRVVDVLRRYNAETTTVEAKTIEVKPIVTDLTVEEEERGNE